MRPIDLLAIWDGVIDPGAAMHLTSDELNGAQELAAMGAPGTPEHVMSVSQQLGLRQMSVAAEKYRAGDIDGFIDFGTEAIAWLGYAMAQCIAKHEKGLK